MNEQQSWQRFSATGAIDAYLMYKQLKEEQNGQYQNEGDSHSSARLRRGGQDADNFYGGSGRY